MKIGHPRGLFMLFFVEMWERFSYYGMRALLTTYLTYSLFEHLSDPVRKVKAYGIFAAYGALVYTTPYIGGWLADKFIGQRRSVFFGAILMMIGHFVMAIPSEFWLYVALAFLILGNGFFKPNISTMVGGLYADDDVRKDAGFTIFYMGINLGAFLSTILCTWVGAKWGPHYGFGLAGVGMSFGLILYWLRQKDLGDVGLQIIKKFKGIRIDLMVYVLSLFSLVLLAVMLQFYEYMSYILPPFMIIAILIIVVKAIRSEKIERNRLFVVLILLFFTTLFWAFFEQAGTSITLFTYENVDLSTIIGQVPAESVQSANPLFILMFAVPISFLWAMLGKKKKEPSTPLKFVLGLFLLGIGFLILGLSPSLAHLRAVKIVGNLSLSAFTVPMSVIVFGYLFHTLGELCLSPIGLSMVTKLAPKNMVAMVMGAWFLSSAMAHHAGGVIAKLTAESEYQTSELVCSDYIFKKLKDSQCFNNSIKPRFIEEELYSRVEQNIAKMYEDGAAFTVSNVSIKSFDIEGYSNKLYDTLVAKQIVTCAGRRDEVVSYLREGFSLGAQKYIENSKIMHDIALEENVASPEEIGKYSLFSLKSLQGLSQYTTVFWQIGIVSMIAALVLLLMVPFLRKMMAGVH